jgi:hypothetical protein
MRVQETAITSASGIGIPAVSAITTAVQQSPPANVSAPTISGSAVEAQTLIEAHGGWSNDPIKAYSPIEVEDADTIGAVRDALAARPADQRVGAEPDNVQFLTARAF